jgi:hypothetical protein
MGTRRTSVADERELALLRERAYGPGGGIDGDAAAVERLAQLEAAHLGLGDRVSAEQRERAPVDPITGGEEDAATAGSSSSDGPRTLRAAAALTRPRSLLAAAVSLIAIVLAIQWLIAPDPDAILRPAEVLPDARLSSLLEDVSELKVEADSLRAFEEFRGIRPWTAEDRYGNPCFIVVDPRADRLLDATCLPPEGELIADVVSWSDGAHGGDLPAGSVIRFHRRGEVVEATVYPAE